MQDYHSLGIWNCTTDYKKGEFYGRYPDGFLDKALALFPDAVEVLHAPSGSLDSLYLPKGHYTIDLVRDEHRCPDEVGDCSTLPFGPNSWDLILCDPPHGDKDSEKYGCDPFPMVKFLQEARRVLRVGGHLGLLYPCLMPYNTDTWKAKSLAVVIPGVMQATRLFSVVEKI